jgi:hypothetical protein
VFAWADFSMVGWAAQFLGSGFGGDAAFSLVIAAWVLSLIEIAYYLK